MLDALAEAAADRAKSDAWGTANQQMAVTQELLHRIYAVLHTAFMQAPHPDPDWEAWRPAHIREAAKEEAAKPLTGRQFLAYFLGKR